MKRLKLLQKLSCKIQKCKKSKIFWLFCGPCGNFFYKIAITSANNPIGQRNHSWLKVFNVLIHEIFRKSTKVAWKREKSVHFEVIVIFGSKLCVFLVQNFVYFLKKAFLTTNLFLVKRLQNSKPPRLSTITQKLHKNFRIRIFLFLSI